MKPKRYFVMIVAVAILFAPRNIAAKCIIQKDASDVRMYVMITPSHKLFFDEWFKQTLKDDYEFVITHHDQGASDGSFMHSGWTQAVLKKVDMIIRAINENWGKVFVYSDVDIQFFRPTWPILSEGMRSCDMLIQRQRAGKKDETCGCTGFFACKGNERALKTWEAVRAFMIDHLEKYGEVGDQVSFNTVMQDNPAQLRLELLPATFMAGDTLRKSFQKIFVPEEIVLHHANFVVGLPKKVRQLRCVRKKFNNMQQITESGLPSKQHKGRRFKRTLDVNRSARTKNR